MKNKIFIQKQKDIEEFKKSYNLQQRIDEALNYIQEDIKSNYFKRYDDSIYKMFDDLEKILRGEDNE
jgi:hypothetical protein